ncbi:MAG: MBL fold metallo-hydrolase [Longimicrobiales bacterium]
MPESPRPWSRRDFVRHSTSCAAHLGLMAAGAPLLARTRWAGQERYPVVAREPWARIERVAEGIWAVVSTPLEDRTTLCNGGIVAGRAGVLVVEGFGSDEGSRWLALKARELTGRLPTHVALSHYHGDHTAGLRGALEEGSPDALVTARTRDLVLERNAEPAVEALERATVLDTRRPTEIDLGGRTVIAVPRRGHTDSDISLEVVDPSVVFCGDLVWNGMFPNYMDATPSRLSLAVRLLRERGADTWVPGHGALAGAADLDRYIAVLDDVEAAATRAVERGWSAEEAGAAYRIPESLGDWMLFSPTYFERAIGAWMSELAG